MAAHNEVGALGEQIACNYLQREGYTIEAINWNYDRAELDIIARIKEVLVFVEVKTTSSSLSQPSLALHPRKQNLLAKAAIAYTHKVQHEWEIRFDLIVVTLDENWMDKIEHYTDAFFPGL